MNSYLEKEPVGKLMLKFCIPCITSLLISCLYNIVDQIFVGNGIGYLGNAATGVIFPITVVGWGLSLLFGDGAAAAISLEAGENINRSSSYAGQTMTLSFLSGLIVSVLYFLFQQPLLLAIGATDATLEMSMQYGSIILFFMPLAMVQNALASVIRAKGHPGYSMGAMCLGAVINIVGDPLAIFVLNMGIAGAAWATIIGQIASLAVCVAFFLRGEDRVTGKDFLCHLSMNLKMARLGFSSFLTQIAVVVITVVNNILLVHYGAQSMYGAEIPLAAFVVLMKLFQIVLNISIGIGAGSQPIAGTNYSSGHYDRVRSLFARMMGASAIITLLFTAAFLIFPENIVQIFGSSGDLYMHFAVRVVRIYLCLITLTCLQKVCSIFLQSIGMALQASILSVLRDVLLIVFSIILPLYSGLEGIFYAAPAADIIAFVITAFIMIRVFAKMPKSAKRVMVPVTE